MRQESTVEILKISGCIEAQFGQLVSWVYSVTSSISKDYRNYHKWYWQKVVPGLVNKTREILIAWTNAGPAGVAILKSENGERKICTLMIFEAFRSQNIATVLLTESFKYLGTTKPLITIPDYKLQQFSAIVQKYSWEQTQVLDKGYYNDTSKELVFNGTISFKNPLA